MGSIELHWKGPYKFIDKERSVFTADESDEPGIYLLCVKYEDGFMVYYTGETGRSFRSRLTEHIKEYLSGYYRIYDTDKFRRGEKEIVWRGTWMKGTKDNLPLFLENYKFYSSKVYDFLNVLELFVAPLNVEKKIRNRVESSIANCFYDCEGIAGSFQERDIRYVKRGKSETIKAIKNYSDVKILGLQKNIQA